MLIQGVKVGFEALQESTGIDIFPYTRQKCVGRKFLKL